MRVYLANSMFSQADRTFNEDLRRQAARLGIHIVLPQALPHNESKAPTARQIFGADTTSLLGCDLVLACLDQETIDCGVACEVGLAFAKQVPTVALCTDFRLARSGEGRVYKNPFVVGALQFGLYRSTQELLAALAEARAPLYLMEGVGSKSKSNFIEYLDSRSSQYDETVQLIGQRTDPPVEALPGILDGLLATRPWRRMLDYGCGTGAFLGEVAERYPARTLVGFDPVQSRVECARGRFPQCVFTSDWAALVDEAKARPFDVVSASFVAHDIPFPGLFIRDALSLMDPHGTLIMHDLSVFDLPNLIAGLLSGLGEPAPAPFYDYRLSPARLLSLAMAMGLNVQWRLSHHQLQFDSADFVRRYLDAFGVAHGMDLPLGIPRNFSDESTFYIERLSQAVSALTFPFTDQRVLLQCTIQRNN